MDILVYSDTCECGFYLAPLAKEAYLEQPRADPTLEITCPSCGLVYDGDSWPEVVVISLTRRDGVT